MRADMEKGASFAACVHIAGFSDAYGSHQSCLGRHGRHTLAIPGRGTCDGPSAFCCC